MDNRKDFYERAFLAALTGLCANSEMWGSEDQAHPLAYVGRSKEIAQASVDAMFKAEESENDREAMIEEMAAAPAKPGDGE